MSIADGNKKRISKKTKKIAGIVAASLVGISITSIVSTICIYDSFFERYERPDYNLYPGIYCYSRIEDKLRRESFKIPSGENMLAAYYYPANSSRGLAVLAHGIHAGADDYLPLIKAIADRGYSVLAYDATGVYSSEGKSSIGMCQSLCDIDNVLNYLKSEKRFADMPKFVIGHSWGGYAAASSLALHPEVKAAALIAPMNDGSTVMLEKGEEYVGKAAYTAKPIFDVYQKLLFGDYVNYNGIVGINSTNAHVLIAQGVDDTVLPHNTLSITAGLDKITNPNLTLFWGEGAQGSHTGIWHSTASEKYQKSIKEMIQKKENELGRELSYDEKVKIYSSVDHELYSEVNSELIDLIIATFDKGLKI